MTIGNINIQEAIQEVKKLMKKEKMSPAFKAVMEVLFVIIKLMSNQLGLNSKNSSKSPSSDPNRQKEKKVSGKKRGGQVGRKGKTLEQVPNPNIIETLKIDLKKLPKGKYRHIGYEKRQVFNLKVEKEVTEYRAEIVEDARGNKFTADFPKEVTQYVQYSDKLKAHVIYLSQNQFIPYNRIQSYFRDRLGLPISVGAIFKFNQKAYQKLEKFEILLIKQLIKSLILHADETGININGKLHWLHCLSNSQWTYFMPHQKRGQEAMNDMQVLQFFIGILIHDHWKPYYKYEHITHALCNAHHLRELQRAYEQDDQQWAKKMQEFLLRVNQEVKEFNQNITVNQIQKWREEYLSILKDGEIESPPPQDNQQEQIGKKRKRGRIKRTKSRNLLERLLNHQEDVLRFISNENVPFTNNLGERDIRMTKVQQKISGCFRSHDGAKYFCRIRSYISSAKKHNISPVQALEALFRGEDIFSEFWSE